ncbi:MAG: FHA domain-containing protein [Pirellulaceae bacterium]|nr:FHA domain-containing protein [Pirellulaceae bacterium]
MQIRLLVTAGPETGRKVLLRSGQVARIGRTEWADFSFPADAGLADVHFAVQCQPSGARVRLLAAEKQLKINDQPATEADLAHGDRISAGGTTFTIQYEGYTEPLAAAAAATLVGAAVVAAPAPATPAPPPEPTAAEIAKYLQLSDDAVAIAEPLQTGPELVAALTAQKKFVPAIRVQAHILPKRHAVWWGCSCVQEVCQGKLPPAEQAAADAAEQWVRDPSESRRRACEDAAEATAYDQPGSWLATAAFWSEGSLGPPEIDPIPPDERLTGQALTSALMIAAVHLDPLHDEARYQAFLKKAQQVASGAIPLPKDARN